MWTLAPFFVAVPALAADPLLFQACVGEQCAGLVKELDEASVKEVSESQERWVVMFYASWCGHCKRYAPTFKKVAASFTEHHGQVKFGGYDCATKPCNSHGITGYPTVKIFDSQNSDGTIVSDREKLTALIRTQLGIDARDTEGQSTEQPDHVDSSWHPGYLSATKSDHWWDAYVAVFFAMKSSLFLSAESGTLPAHVFQAAQKYLSYIVDHFPDKSLVTHLHDLHTFLRNATLDNESAWRAELDARFAEQTRNMTFASCTTYTCAQWNLFHALAEQVNSADASSRIAFYEVVTIFPTYFFGCVECRAHFLAMLNRTAEERKTMPANIWFWKAHNEVTMLVHNGARPEWPPVEVCSTCWDAHGSPIENEIVSYLKRDYGADTSAAGAFLTWLWSMLLFLF